MFYALLTRDTQRESSRLLTCFAGCTLQVHANQAPTTILLSRMFRQ